MSKAKKAKKPLGRYYYRIEALKWLPAARRDGWYLEGVGRAILRWKAAHRSAPSPYLVCRYCGDHALDPVLLKYRAKKDGTEEIGDILDHSPESFARVPCPYCGSKRQRDI